MAALSAYGNMGRRRGHRVGADQYYRKKNSQRRLEDSEQTFRTLLETAPKPLVLAAEGKYLYANQKTTIYSVWK